MPQLRLLRTSTFRLALLYLGLFGVSVLALLGFIYWTTAGFMAQQTDQTIEAEIVGLAERYRRDGLIGLRQVIAERSRNQRHSLYLLATPARDRLAGNIDSWPARQAQDGWVDFYYERPAGEVSEIRAARGRTFVLLGGFQLLVGRDVQDRRDIADLMRQSLAWAVILTLGLGTIGGVLMSRNALRRIDAIGRTSREIMAGDLSRRVAVSGTGDELDRLAESLNAMLDEIEALMTGMRQVTDNIAHDLRSPLNRLRSRLELTLLGPPSIDAYRDALERTIAESEALLATFNALLAIAQAEAAQPESMAPLDLGALARDVAEFYAPVAEDAGLSFRVSVEPGTMIRGERHLLSQALANLVDNAIKYTPAGGTVAVTVQAQANEIETTVADSGPGIPPADRERVFDRFVRLETSRNSAGSGLGLSLVRAVAQRHRATIALEDGAPGLLVRLRFPAYSEGHAETAARAQPGGETEIDERRPEAGAGGVLAEDRAYGGTHPVRP